MWYIGKLNHFPSVDSFAVISVLCAIGVAPVGRFVSLFAKIRAFIFVSWSMLLR